MCVNGRETAPGEAVFIDKPGSLLIGQKDLLCSWSRQNLRPDRVVRWTVPATTRMQAIETQMSTDSAPI